MLKSWQIDAILDLVRQRYPDWNGFAHPDFVVDELVPKRRLRKRFLAQLGADVLQTLLKEQQYAEIVARITKIGRNNNFLYNRIPAKGDLKLLFVESLPRNEFCHQFEKALYGSADPVKRLATWQQFLQKNALPEQWAFITFFMFLADPVTSFFVKPEPGRWLLQFAGRGERWSKQLHPETWRELNALAGGVFDSLSAYQPTDLIDIQSVLWIAHRESRGQAGGLPVRAQIALDQPPTIYRHRAPRPELVREDSAEYNILPNRDALPIQPTFSLSDAAALTHRNSELLATWKRALERKGQIILYGPPGTGKTFTAQALARHIVSESNGVAELIQLHPGYAYEDFVHGLRPVTKEGVLTFESVPGRFLEFCQRAARRDAQTACVLILDEINRADLARVFGELMYLLEYRDREIVLAGGEQFNIPSNVQLIGTMNTADRSIALVDYALRRRFAFIAIKPDYEILRRFHQTSSFPIESLVKVLQNLNSQIEPDYQLGCSYFLRQDLEHSLSDIWQTEIEPYLDEYFYGRQHATDLYKWQSVQKNLLSS